MAMAAALPDARRRLVDTSPVEALKARKNEAEVAGLVSAGRKDAAALCSYFAWLEAAASAASQPVAFAAAALAPPSLQPAHLPSPPSPPRRRRWSPASL